MLEFVRAAILDSEINIASSATIDWDGLLDISSEHGLLAWVWDGICKLPNNHQPNRQHRINWGLSAQEIWDNYYHHQEVLREIIATCTSSNLKFLLLKGLSLSELYPKPESRPSGDIDIYFFEDCQHAASILSQGSSVLSGKHYVFDKSGVEIECHLNLIDIGTSLQKRANDYIVAILGDSIYHDEGYYTLSFFGTLIHTLMHIIAHFYNPGPDPLKIRSLIDYAMLLREVKAKGVIPEYQRVITLLELEDFSELFVRLSEWLLNIDLSDLYIHEKIRNEDIDRIKHFLLHPELRNPQFDNFSFIQQLIQRVRYYKETRWKYYYLPEIKWRRLPGLLKLQFHLFVKSIFGFPFDQSFMYSVKHGNK